MNELLSTIEKLSGHGAHSLNGIRRGIEKEALRISYTGRLAQTPHPSSLGSSLTHPHITTDFSEALLEFITPPCTSISELFKWLDEIHRFSAEKLHHQNELLWLSSMPCVIDGDESIPIAQYGTSNIARMKHIYRVGLGHRYGRSMQTISGIHYNFSLPDDFWIILQSIEKHSKSLQDYKTEKYFSLIRNFRRNFWLLLYLFGAAPAMCPTFVKNREHRLQKLGDKTLHLPGATSLRMGDLGYQSRAQSTLMVDYNSLDAYIASLHKGLTTSHPDYEKIGVLINGDYRQLNSNLLQIENEFYSTIRPKRTVDYGEAPILALKQRGVEYIEVRSIDVNPFDLLGIDKTQAYFLEAFLLYCLLEPSPPSNSEEYGQIAENQHRVVNNGRDPQQEIFFNGQLVKLRECGKKLLDGIKPVANLLAVAINDSAYINSLDDQHKKLLDENKTPSGRILAALNEENLSFFELAMRRSTQHNADFRSRPLEYARENYFTEAASASDKERLLLEKNAGLDFSQYLKNYFQQYFK